MTHFNNEVQLCNNKKFIVPNQANQNITLMPFLSSHHFSAKDIQPTFFDWLLLGPLFFDLKNIFLTLF